MKSNPTIAAVLANDLAAYGARRCFGLLGTANFKVSHALVHAGVELISARHAGALATDRGSAALSTFAKSGGLVADCRRRPRERDAQTYALL